jgi:hypothetical protein
MKRGIQALGIIAIALGTLIQSAKAYEEGDQKKDRKHHKHHDNSVEVEVGGSGVNVYRRHDNRAYYRDYRDWHDRDYYRHGRTVIIEREHPVYYGYGEDVAVAVQRRLARAGYYRGPLDGEIGPGTRAAIRAYQIDNGLAPTARINGALLDSLGLR